MAQIITLLLAGLSVGLGNFAASIAIGLAGLDKSLRIKIALVFGVFETGMPIVGLLLGHQVAGKLGGHANLVGGTLLILTGLHLVFKAVQGADDKEVKKAASSGLGQLAVTGVALSIDNLIVGFSLGAHHQPLAETALVIGITSVALSLVGLEIGSRLNSRVEEYSEILSGAILVLVGLALGFKWL